MEITGILSEIRPIYHTYVFELKRNWKKFIIFIIIISLIAFLLGTLPYLLIPENTLSPSQINYMNDTLGFINLILIFSICFFFGGIICSEYHEKTGYIVFPKINKFKLIIGKYLGNLTLNIVVIGFYYGLTALTTMYFYGLPIYFKLFQSFAIAVLYLLAVSAFVTLFSSFLKTSLMTTVATILILLIGFSIVDSIVTLALPDFEPLYSLEFVSRLITGVITKDFPDSKSGRYTDFEVQGFKFRQWLHPSIEGGIIVLLLYMAASFLLAAYLFKKRQL
ncbi:MAG: hypothetical protein R6U96_09575 [Promethearchaeia archaeon]